MVMLSVRTENTVKMFPGATTASVSGSVHFPDLKLISFWFVCLLLTLAACHVSCELLCHGSGPGSCVKCKEGYVMEDGSCTGKLWHR